MKKIFWIIANIFGIYFGAILGTLLHTAIWPFDNYCPDLCLISHAAERILIVGLFMGLVIGIVEFILFRMLTWRWVFISVIGWSLAILVGGNLPDFFYGMEGLFIGLVIGIAEWIIIRKIIKRPALWIVARVLGCLIAYNFRTFVINEHFSIIPSNAIYLLLFGVANGIATSLLIREKER